MGRPLIVILLLAGLGLASPAHATVVFNGDFERGDLAQWSLGDTQSDRQWCNADDAVVYTRTSHPSWPRPPVGARAVRLKAEDSDVTPCTPTGNPRSQLGSAPIMAADTTYFESWRMFVPTTFPDVPSTQVGSPPANPFFVGQQDFAAPFSGSPPIGFGFSDSGDGVDRIDARLDDAVATRIWQTPLAALKGTWIKFVTEKRVASDGSGYLKLWVNDVAQRFACTAGSARCPTSDRTYLHTTLKPGSTERHRFYVNNYRRKGQAATTTLYFDNAKVGTTLADVNTP
jgi:hypothetical protein